MFVNGVGLGGKDVTVVNDFSIHVPYSWCYIIDEFPQPDEPTFTLFLPLSEPENYKDGRFSMPAVERNTISGAPFKSKKHLQRDAFINFLQ